MASIAERLESVWAEKPRLATWLTTVDHTKIGFKYLYTGLIFFVLAGIMSLIMRVQLAQAELEHASFFGTAMLFWAVVIDRSRRAVSYGPRILFVFTTALQSSALGVLLIFAGGVLYRSHLITAHDWGLSTPKDQQLAGALMWIPPGFVYFLAIAILFVKWLRDVERRAIPVRPGEL